MDVVPYTEGFRAQMVSRMLGPAAVSAHELAKQVGVTQPTLSKWLRQARRFEVVKPPEDRKPETPPPPKKWTAEEKLRVVGAAQGQSGEQLGALLRREGVHEAQLQQWREAAAGALQSAEVAPSGPLTAGQRRRLASAEKRVKELERDLRRKEKALAEAAALLILEKKLQALGWDERHQHQGDEDGESSEENET